MSPMLPHRAGKTCVPAEPLPASLVSQPLGLLTYHMLGYTLIRGAAGSQAKLSAGLCDACGRPDELDVGTGQVQG